MRAADTGLSDAGAGRQGQDALQSLPTCTGLYDRWAATYDTSGIQHMVHLPVHQAILDLARRSCREPRRILDAGCGTGRLLARLSVAFPEAACVGADPSAPMLHHCPAPASTAALVRTRGEHLPFRDATFDLIVSTLSLLHWDDPAAGLVELARVAAPEGLILLADAFPRHRPRRWSSSHHPDPDLRAVFARAGLNLRAQYPDPLAVTGVTVLLVNRNRRRP